MVQKHDLSYPVVYGLDYREEAEKLGVYTDSERGFIHPANFILRRDSILQITYSEGPLGRFQPKNVLRFIDSYRDREN